MVYCKSFNLKVLPEGLLRRGLLVTIGWLICHIVAAQVPTAPINFYVISADGQNELSWSANPAAEGVTDYTVYRSLDKLSFTNLATISGSSTLQYTDNTVENGITYFYYLTATNGTGEGPASIVDAGEPQSDFGEFMVFDGSTDSVTINNSDELQLANESFTIGLWVRVKSLPDGGNEAYLVSRFQNGTNNETYALRFNNTGQLEFRTNGSASSFKRTVETLTENNWYHIAVVYNNNPSGPFVFPGEVQIYINGILTTDDQTSSIIADPLSSVDGRLVIGADVTVDNRFFDGYMDELYIWDRVRTPAEIMSDQCTRFRGDESGLLGLWHFDEEEVEVPVVYDYTPNANNGGNNIDIIDFTPVARDDFGLITENTSGTINIQSNDVSISTMPLVGTLMSGYPLSGNANLMNNDSTVSYTPNSGFFGVDTVKYIVSDTAVFCNTAPEKDTAMVFVYVQCNQRDELNWNDRSPGSDVTTATIIENGLFFDFSSTDNNGILTSFIIGSDFQSTNALVWKQDPSTNTEESITKLTFNRKVDQFCLDLMDIDADPAGFADSIVVNAYREGNLVRLTERDFTAGTAVDFKGQNSFTGNTLVDDAVGTDGNVSLCFFVPIDSMHVVFTNASGASSNPSEQSLGIGNFTWCSFPNRAPVVTSEGVVATDTLFYQIPTDSTLVVCLNITDADRDSVSISVSGVLSGTGDTDIATPLDTCFTYTPEEGSTGTEAFTVTVCDNRPDQLCTEVVVSVRLETPPPPPPPPIGDFFISEALTPNGDRILDHWEITGIERFPNNHVKVFNIWGDLIFQQSGYNNDERAWTGQTGKGAVIGSKEAPDGTYFYVLDLQNGEELLKGHVVLKR
ncbi:T9SS type B sorting domain-containing protein [Fulvivirga sp. M361]|uniref:LamG-like jellyroll fold domain-containing protein n=1 Tax=Fulvivirga sp. M361 TaxID=2594266 RepID=UPI00117AB0DA|nr:LamG-like jellyroll fold domain-containing protein [Fulvivirga sp. M361]TRX49700.1 T9SS type B sorting domain-containing protein [Fulvivirga sp. M361]